MNSHLNNSSLSSSCFREGKGRIDSTQSISSRNPLSKQNVLINERLLEHQTRIMELQLRHLQNNQTNQKVLNDANKQLHVVFPQSSMETPSQDGTFSNSLYAPENSQGTLEHSSSQNGEFITSYELDGSNVSLSLSNITTHHEHQHIDVETIGNTIEQASPHKNNPLNSSLPAVNSPFLDMPISTKPVATQKDNVEEKEVAVQTSILFDSILTSSICSDDAHQGNHGIQNESQLHQQQQCSMIEEKKERLRSKYPNLFDESHSKEASVILQRMCSEEENDYDARVVLQNQSPASFSRPAPNVHEPAASAVEHSNMKVTNTKDANKKEEFSGDSSTTENVDFRVVQNYTDAKTETLVPKSELQSNFNSKDTDEPSPSSVANVLEELKNLQMCFNNETQHVVNSSSESELTANDVLLNRCRGHLTTNNNRLVRVSENPDVSPIKEVEESMLKSKQQSKNCSK